MNRVSLQLSIVVFLCVSMTVSASCPFSKPSVSRRSLKQAGTGLQFGFYDTTCPSFDQIVVDKINSYTQQNSFTPGKLLRLFLHDCAVSGCDASILLESNPPGNAEKDAPIAANLAMFNVIDDIKTTVEAQCPGIVSCADILALAAVHSVAKAGGPSFTIDLGRRDGSTSYAADETAAIPQPSFNVDQLLENFANFGLDVNDLVALSGAHTIGEAHCTSFVERFQAGGTAFPDARFGQELYAFCSNNGASDFATLNRRVVMDSNSATIFDSSYFINLIQGQGVLTSDQVLYNDQRTSPLVQSFASNQAAFFTSFQASMLKMGRVGVLTGTDGVIRQKCSVSQ